MKLVYSRRALADLNSIAIYYTASASPTIAQSIERRLADVIDRIGRAPESAPRISQRSPVRVVRSFAIHFGFFTGCVTTPSIFCTFDTPRGGP
jgi:toxin ParE1/3/4